MKKLLVLFLSGFLSLLFANIGKISVSKGEVTVIRNNTNLQASNNFILEKSDQIKTGEDGKAQLIFTDNTLITIGAKSLLNVSEYIFDEQNQKAEANFNVVEGTFRTITGKIGKTNPDKFKLQTKSASIGIRGTIFGGDENKVFCEDGQIAVNSNGVEVIVNKDEIIEVSSTQPPSTPRTATKQEKEAVKESSGSNDPDMQQNEQSVVEQKNSQATTQEETKQEENTQEQATNEASMEEGSFEATPTPQEAPTVVNVDNVVKNVEETKTSTNDAKKQDTLVTKEETKKSNDTPTNNTSPSTQTSEHQNSYPEYSLLRGMQLVNGQPYVSLLKLTPQGTDVHGRVTTKLEYEDDDGFEYLTTLAFDKASEPYNSGFDYYYTTYTNEYTPYTLIKYDNKGEFITHIDYYEIDDFKLAYYGKTPTMSALDPTKIYQYSIKYEMETTQDTSSSYDENLYSGSLGTVYMNGQNKSVFMDTEKYVISDGYDNYDDFGSSFNVMRLNSDGTLSGKYYTNNFNNDGDLYHESAKDEISGSLYGSELQGLGLKASGQKYERFEETATTSLISTSYLSNITTSSSPTSITMDGYLTGFAFQGTSSGDYHSGSSSNSIAEDFAFTINTTNASINGSDNTGDLSYTIAANNAALSAYYINKDQFGALLSISKIGFTQSASDGSWFFTIPDSYDSIENELTSDTEDYSSWGYWTATSYDDAATKANLLYVDKYSTWVAGEVTPTSTIQTLIDDAAIYNFTGNVLGSINGGMGTNPILMDTSNQINLQISFGTGVLTGYIQFNDIDNTLWKANITGGFTTSGFNSSSVSTTAGDQASISGGSLNGKFYGPEAQSVGGKFQLDSSSGIASGVFKAKRQ
jgi:hypothetical protein